MCRSSFLLLALALLWPQSAQATRIYSFVDYPDLQNGHSLSGTITTTDDAPDDGLLQSEEILDWEWEVRDELEVPIAIGQKYLTIPHSSSLMEIFGIQIDSLGVYLPQKLGSFIDFEIRTGLNSRGGNFRNLAWLNGNPATPSRYFLSGITGGDISFQAWGNDLPAKPDRWLIATRVPEPSSLIISVCVLAYAVAMSRWRMNSMPILT